MDVQSQNNFRECEIYPFDRSVIDDDILKPSEVFISQEVSDTQTESGSGLEREDVERDVSVVNDDEQDSDPGVSVGVGFLE